MAFDFSFLSGTGGYTPNNPGTIGADIVKPSTFADVAPVSPNINWGGEYNPWANLDKVMTSPQMIAVLGSVGSQLAGGAKSPIGMAGLSAANFAQGQIMNENLRKILGSTLGGPASTGADSSLSSSPLPTGADVVGLTPEMVDKVYGSGLEASKISNDMKKFNMKYPFDVLQTMASAGSLNASALLHSIQARKAQADMERETARETSWEDLKKRYKAIQSGEAQGKLPAFLDDTTLPIIYGMDAKTGEAFMGDLIKLHKTLGKQFKLGHYADYYGGNLHVFNDSDAIIQVPTGKTNPDGSPEMRDVMPGGSINKIPIGTRGIEDRAGQVGLINAGRKRAIEEFGKQLEADYIASFPTTEAQEAKKQFQGLMAMIADEKKGPDAIMQLMMRANPKTRASIDALADKYSKSLSKGGGYSGVSGASDAANKTSPDATPSKAEQEFLTKYGKDVVANLVKAKKPSGTYPVTITDGDKKIKWKVTFNGTTITALEEVL